jgi:multimeric flavodoxin WrbA
MKILAIVASPRVKGNTSYLVDQALAEAAKSGIETEKIILNRYKVQPCLAHDDCASFDSCKIKDDMIWILDKFCAADAVILATPVYYWNVSAQMKTFIDRNFFLYGKSKKAQASIIGTIVISADEGNEDVLHIMDHFINASFNIDKDRRLVISGHAGAAGEVKDNNELVTAARKMGQDMAEALKNQGKS